MVNLRHRYSSGGKFSVDDTLFYSDEGLNLHGEEQHRRFLQFNGYANWRPATSKPLLVVGRLVAQGTHAELIAAVAADPGDSAVYESLQGRINAYFPDHFAFTEWGNVIVKAAIVVILCFTN